MGTEDMRRQAPNVERMRLLGAEVAPVEAGARTLKEAVSAAIRDWVTNVATTHYIIGSAVGPAPYPALVRDLQRVIGDEAREQALAAEGELPRRVIACVGGGSNAIGTFTAFLDDPVDLIGVEAGGEGLETGATARRSGPGGRASSMARCRRFWPTRTARSSKRTRSPPGSTTRASAPSTPTCATPAAPRYEAVTDEEALRAFRELSRLEGIIPALEPAHAIAWLLQNPGSDGYDVVCLSRARRQGPRRGARRARAARWLTSAAASGSPPPSMRPAPRAEPLSCRTSWAGIPDVETSIAVADAYASSGADLVELGVPFSDPLADGPVIHAAATAALGAGATLEGVLGICERIADRVAAVPMCYANPVLAHGPAEFAALLAGAGAAGAIVPDLPPEEGGEVAARLNEVGLPLVPLVAPTTAPARRAEIAGRAEGFVYLVSGTRVTGERDELPPGLGELIEATKADARVPVAVGFGIGTPDQAAAVGKVADGVIIGTRLVRAVAESADARRAASAVGGFLRQCREAM